MGRVARLILLVVVSVCVVFCVLCCLQNNPVFSSVTYLIISKMKIMSYVFWRVSSLRPEKKGPVVCLAGVSVFGSGGKSAVFLLRREIFITTGKKKKVVCLLGARFWRLRPEKKDTVVCLAGCAVVLFFVVAGNFDYDRKKKNQYYDRKKKIQLSTLNLY